MTQAANIRISLYLSFYLSDSLDLGLDPFAFFVSFRLTELPEMRNLYWKSCEIFFISYSID